MTMISNRINHHVLGFPLVMMMIMIMIGMNHVDAFGPTRTITSFFSSASFPKHQQLKQHRQLSSLAVLKKENNRNIDISNVMDEMEEALKAAEVALTNVEQEKKKAQQGGSNQQTLDEIDYVVQEAMVALEAAEEALQGRPSSISGRSTAAVIPSKRTTRAVEEPSKPPKRGLTLEEEKQQVASVIGGVVTGIALGVLASIAIPDLDLILDPTIPPMLGAAILGVTFYAAAANEGTVGSIVRTAVGGSVQVVGNAALNGIQAAADGMTSAAQRQVEKTTNEIKAIPTKVGNEIKTIPGKVVGSAAQLASEVADELKATPGRVAESTKRAVNSAVEKAKDSTKNAVEKAVDEVKSMPKRAVDTTVASVKGKVDEVAAFVNPMKQQQSQEKSKEKKDLGGLYYD